MVGFRLLSYRDFIVNDSPFILVPFDITKLQRVFGNVVDIANIEQSQELDLAKSITTTFDWIIDFLRNQVFDLETQARFAMIHQLIGNKQSMFVAVHPKLQDCVCALVGAPPQIMFLLPPNFHQRFEEDMLFQVGAIVHAGFCAMYYGQNWLEYVSNINGPIASGIHKAANMEEGRFLELFYRINPEQVVTEFHQELIDMYNTYKPD
jgi:hypothetical protein